MVGRPIITRAPLFDAGVPPAGGQGLKREELRAIRGAMDRVK